MKQKENHQVGLKEGCGKRCSKCNHLLEEHERINKLKKLYDIPECQPSRSVGSQKNSEFASNNVNNADTQTKGFNLKEEIDKLTRFDHGLVIPLFEEFIRLLKDDLFIYIKEGFEEKVNGIIDKRSVGL